MQRDVWSKESQYILISRQSNLFLTTYSLFTRHLSFDDGAGFEMSIFCKPVLVLEDYGLKASDITDVVITHAHHDHIAAIGTYANAVIHIQEKEYEVGKKYIPARFKVHTFDDEFLLCDGVIVRNIGGHSYGSSIVICQLDEKNYIFCGDECYVKTCFDRQIPTGASYRPEVSENSVEILI